MRLHINKDNKASSWQNCHISKMILGEFENFTQGPGGPAWLVSHEVAIAMVPQKAQWYEGFGSNTRHLTWLQNITLIHLVCLNTFD